MHSQVLPLMLKYVMSEDSKPSRPLISTTLEHMARRTRTDRYHAGRQLWVDELGNPIVGGGLALRTFTEKDPVDPPQPKPKPEPPRPQTFTRVVQESADV